VPAARRRHGLPPWSLRDTCRDGVQARRGPSLPKARRAWAAEPLLHLRQFAPPCWRPLQRRAHRLEQVQQDEQTVPVKMQLAIAGLFPLAADFVQPRQERGQLVEVFYRPPLSRLWILPFFRGTIALPAKWTDNLVRHRGAQISCRTLLRLSLFLLRPSTARKSRPPNILSRRVWRAICPACTLASVRCGRSDRHKRNLGW
jgi:hypothetical protein